MEIILASASPRRKELLSTLYPNFKIMPTDVDESTDESDPEKRVIELSFRKGKAIAEKRHEALVIAADTVVYLKGKYFNKPLSEKDAE